MSTENFDDFVTSYYQRFAQALQDMDTSPLKDVLAVFEKVSERGGTLWTAGNGGSAAMADHAVCDISKGTYVEGQAPLRTVALTSNGPIVTALGNDISYDDIFSEQLKYYLKKEDAVLFISSSGNSANVVKACEYANAQGVTTIAFVGFKGGKLGEIATHTLHVANDNYGIVEDAHMSFIHVLTQYMKARATA